MARQIDVKGYFSIKLVAKKEGIYEDSISIYGFEKLEGAKYIAQPIELKLISDEEAVILQAPICKLSAEASQYLMDSLWDCGLRPSEGSGSAGALAATQRHLEDMRTLVFDYLRKVKID